MLQIAGSYVANEAPVVGSLAKTYKYAEQGRKLGSMWRATRLQGCRCPRRGRRTWPKHNDYDPAKDKNTNSPRRPLRLIVLGRAVQPQATRHSKSVIPQDVQKAIPGKSFGRESLPTKR
jgi:hypothetical protein